MTRFVNVQHWGANPKKQDRWSGRPVSNWGPSAPKADALTRLRYAPYPMADIRHPHMGRSAVITRTASYSTTPDTGQPKSAESGKERTTDQQRSPRRGRPKRKRVNLPRLPNMSSPSGPGGPRAEAQRRGGVFDLAMGVLRVKAQIHAF
jgi:hypothetical protein